MRFFDMNLSCMHPLKCKWKAANKPAESSDVKLTAGASTTPVESDSSGLELLQ